MISAANLLIVLDSLAAQAGAFEAALGLTGLEAGTVSKGAENNLATLMAEADTDLNIALMLGTFSSRSQRVRATGLYHTITGRDIYRALESHLAPAGGLNKFLRDNGRVVHPSLSKLGFTIDPDLRFIPADVLLATFTLTGAGAGNMVAGAQVDGSLYGDARIVAKPTTLIGPAQITATVRTANRAGAEVNQQVVIPAASIIGSRVVLATRGQRVVSISVVGGTAGDTFQIIAETERAIIL